MPKLITPLTDTSLKNAKPKAKPYHLFDGGGMYALVLVSGTIRFYLKYQRPLGGETRIHLGDYPHTSLAEARRQKEEIKANLKKGIDPLIEQEQQARLALEAQIREETEAKTTFESIAARWLEHWKDGKSERHVEYTRRRLELDIFPSIGVLPIATITAKTIRLAIQKIQERGVNDLPHRCFNTVGQILRYAVAHDIIELNPAASLKPGDFLKAAPSKNYARVELRELPELLRQIEAYRGHVHTRLAMQLMALTFVRTSELIEASWDEIDWQSAQWRIPAERMKMKSPHIVPLSSQALRVLELLKIHTGHQPFLFPSESRRATCMSNNTILKALERMGYKGRMTGHGFRGIASTALHEMGFQHEHIELQLAHCERDEVSAAYNHALYLQQRTQMMQHWGDFIEAQGKGAQVIPFRMAV